MILSRALGRPLLYLISMNDLTTEERAAAAAQGWGLFHVFDLARGRWNLAVLPPRFGPGMHAERTLRAVIEQARNNHPVALKALRLIAAFNAGKAGKEGKKR
jgi:hypothetical protein